MEDKNVLHNDPHFYSKLLSLRSADGLSGVEAQIKKGGYRLTSEQVQAVESARRSLCR